MKILENAPHLSTGEILCFSMVTQGHIQQESRRRKYRIYAGLFDLIPPINQILHQVISIFFILNKMLWMTKNVLKKIWWRS